MMVRKFFLQFDKIHGLPKRVMLGGLLPAALLLCVAVFLYLPTPIPYRILILSRQLCQTAVSLCAEGLVLGLFLDVLLSRS